MRIGMVTPVVLALALTSGSAVGAADELAAGVFTPAGSLIEAREGHQAVLLVDGRVLVVGGQDGYFDYRPAAEVWDPETGTFAPAGALAEARDAHTATRLSDGRVLVIGGWGVADDPLSSVEAWDPLTESFGPTARLGHARGGHTATLLSDGRILVVGGHGASGNPDYTSLSSAETWDPMTETFAPTGSLTEARVGHTATLLADGRVLVAGGRASTLSTGYLSTAEVWDSATGTFSPTGSLAGARDEHTAVLLPDGRLIIAGGYDEDSRSVALIETWNPALGEFSGAGSDTGKAKDGAMLTPLPDGQVLAIGGQGAEVWNPTTGILSPAGALLEARSVDTPTLLADGRVLVVGGWREDVVLSSAEVWGPTSPASQ